MGTTVVAGCDGDWVGIDVRAVALASGAAIVLL
jgi:hypothetical protein